MTEPSARTLTAPTPLAPAASRRLMRTGDGGPAPARVPPIVHDVLRTPGAPLDPAARGFMESRFGHDFSRVRVHSDQRAAASARAVNAAAYTVGRDMVFASGRYAPGTAGGRRLLAHELTHVVQQSSNHTGTPNRIGSPTDAAEHEADRTATNALATDSIAPISNAEPALRRQEEANPNLTLPGPAPLPADAGSSPSDAGTTPTDAGTPAGATRTFSLTFDDGPHAAALGTGDNRTEKVLDVLKAKGVKAGFFIQTGVTYRGASAVGRALVSRMAAEGHTVGVHTGGTKDHELHPAAEKAGRLETELNAAKAYVKAQTGSDPAYVRPPTGASNAAVLATYKKTGLTNLLWDIDGDQGANLDLATLKQRVQAGITTVKNGGWKTTTPSPNIVVLYHDIQKGTADNIGALIDHIKATTNTVSGNKDTATFAAP